MYGSTIFKSKKSHGSFLDDSNPDDHDHLNSQSQQIAEQPQSKLRSRLKKLQLNWIYSKIIIAFLVIVLIVVFSFEQAHRQRNEGRIADLTQKMLQSECLVEGNLNSFEKCEFILKNTKSNQIIRPRKVRETPLHRLEINNVAAIQQMHSNIKSKFQFSKAVFLNWLNNNQTLDALDYYRLHKEYNLQDQVGEKFFCVVSPFYNLINDGAEKSSLHLFLKSINAQNYSNYHVFMIDDASKDLSTNYILNQLPKYPYLNNRITIIKNNVRLGALANRDLTIRNFCRPGQIVIDIDGDDCLIGKQVFNMYNRLYHRNNKTWFLYTNHIRIKGSYEGDGRKIEISMGDAKQGASKSLAKQVLKNNNYRTADIWSTSQLRSYLFDLYVKIPFSYLIDVQEKSYYWEASDRFTMYALIELAGQDHTFYYEEYPYFYYEPNFDVLRAGGCSIHVVFYNQAKSRLLTPLKNLVSLQEQARKTRNYSVPAEIDKYFLSKKIELIECTKIHGNN